jgi:hypothetical protein
MWWRTREPRALLFRRLIIRRNMELTGKIIVVQEPKSGTSSRTGNPWMMQEYVIEVPGQYPRHCAFTVFGEDRIKQLNIQMREDLTVQFDIDAREYNGRWFNDFRAYNVIRNQATVQAQTIQADPNPPFSNQPFDAPTPGADDPFNTNDGSELPF